MTSDDEVSQGGNKALDGGTAEERIVNKDDNGDSNNSSQLESHCDFSQLV